MKDKKIDAVKMMREIRDSLSQEYLDSPEKEQQMLELIRKKHGLKNKRDNTRINLR